MAGGLKGQKTLSLGTRLKYPIKITRLYKNPGDAIRRQEPVLQYSFEYTMELPNDRETLQLQTKTLTSITDWNAPEDGKLIAWQVRVGDVLTRDRPCFTVEEACTHEIQFQGLCAICGKDMNEVNWASEHRDSERAPINMTHDQTNLTVSKVAATRAEGELQRRLLVQRKLSLVVDLDQTIIHACIDPTIGEWQQDPSNPNYESLKDVRRFQLDEGFQGPARGCWYYIKMRPGLAGFLERISNLYELHVYTMGTRTYATNIAQIVDPEQRYFGNRVISRDENGNIVSKTLQRLFPVSTHMAVIMDDRADVWPRNRQNLIKVTPYDFFKGTGDINSSFLPKRSDISTPATDDSVADVSAAAAAAAAAGTVTATSSIASTAAVAADQNPASTSRASTAAVEAMASPAGVNAKGNDAKLANGAKASEKGEKGENGENGEESIVLQKQAEEQERTIEKQIKDRPLLHMQEQLDKADEAAAAAAAAADTTLQASAQSDPQPAPPQRHCVLHDDDDELKYLEEHLTLLHCEFFKEYDSRRRLALQSGDQTLGDHDGVTAVPDVGETLERLKEEVLQGTTIVLSGLIPLGHSVEQSEIGLQAMSFGAKVQNQVSRRVTHLVISSDRPRTQKVRQAARIPSIKVVNQHWLADCFSQWTWLDETPYLVNIHPADRDRSAAASTPAEVTDSETVSDQEGVHGNGVRKPRIAIVRTLEAGSTPTDADNRADGDVEEGDGDGTDGTEADDDDGSPIAELGQFDWGSADDELEMFLAEGDDDDDEDASRKDYGEGDSEVASNYGEDTDDGEAMMPSKRKHGDDTDTDSEPPRNRRLQAKRARLGGARSRSSSKLRTVATPGSVNGVDVDGVDSGGRGRGMTTALPMMPSRSANIKEAAAVSKTEAEPELDDDELEAMLMAELDGDDGAEGGLDS